MPLAIRRTRIESGPADVNGEFDDAGAGRLVRAHGLDGLRRQHTPALLTRPAARFFIVQELM